MCIQSAQHKPHKTKTHQVVLVERTEKPHIPNEDEAKKREEKHTHHDRESARPTQLKSTQRFNAKQRTHRQKKM